MRKRQKRQICITVGFIALLAYTGLTNVSGLEYIFFLLVLKVITALIVVISSAIELKLEKDEDNIRFLTIFIFLVFLIYLSTSIYDCCIFS